MLYIFIGNPLTIIYVNSFLWHLLILNRVRISDGADVSAASATRFARTLCNHRPREPRSIHVFLPRRSLQRATARPIFFNICSSTFHHSIVLYFHSIILKPATLFLTVICPLISNLDTVFDYQKSKRSKQIFWKERIFIFID